MSPEAHARLVEIDEVARAMRDFYEHAAAVLPGSTLRERCQRLARAKAEIVALVALRLPLGQPVNHALAPRSDLAEKIVRVLSRARLGLATPDPARLWDELQRVESAFAEACEQAAVHSRDPDCRRELGWMLPLLARCRDEFASAAG